MDSGDGNFFKISILAIFLGFFMYADSLLYTEPGQPKKRGELRRHSLTHPKSPLNQPWRIALASLGCQNFANESPFIWGKKPAKQTRGFRDRFFLPSQEAGSLVSGHKLSITVIVLNKRPL